MRNLTACRANPFLEYRYGDNGNLLTPLATPPDSSVASEVGCFEYGAWGNLLGGSFDNVPGGMPYRFVGSLGCRSDFVTGLVYMRHRWYDPELQRFISRDPIGLRGGSNLYAYPLNPSVVVDPIGLRPEIDAVKLSAIGGRNFGTGPSEARIKSRLFKMLSRSSHWNRYTKCFEKVFRENKIIFDIFEEGFHGQAGYAGEIHLNPLVSENDLVFILFHEGLHKATNGACTCVPEESRVVQELVFDQKGKAELRKNKASHRRSHAWIYWEVNRFFKDSVNRGDYYSYPTIETKRFDIDRLAAPGVKPNFIKLADDLELMGYDIGYGD